VRWITRLLGCLAGHFVLCGLHYPERTVVIVTTTVSCSLPACRGYGCPARLVYALRDPRCLFPVGLWPAVELRVPVCARFAFGRDVFGYRVRAHTRWTSLPLPRFTFVGSRRVA